MKKTLSIKDAPMRRGALGAKAFAVAVLPLAISTHAAQFEFENGSSLAWDNYFTYGAQWRVQGRDDKLVGDPKERFSVVRAAQGADNDFQDLPDSKAYQNYLNQVELAEDATLKMNTDDGNLNFDSGDMTQNKVTWISEMDFKGSVDDVEYGAFLRAKAYYDEVYAVRSTSLKARDYWRYNAGNMQNTGEPGLPSRILAGGWGFADAVQSAQECKDLGYACRVGPEGWEGTAEVGEFAKDTRDELGAKARFLDAFVYTNFEIGGQKLALRVGEQVINMGESNFFPGLMGMVNSLNAYDSHQPGVEVKELLLPTGAIDLKWAMNADISFEAYYQYDWEPHYLDPAGSFFSMADFLGAGASSFGVMQYWLPNDGQITNLNTGATPSGSHPSNDPNMVMLGFLPGETHDARESGQWGFGGHYMFEDGSDIGLYHVIYHSKIPSLVMNPRGEPWQVPLFTDGGLNAPTHYEYVPVSYDVEYKEDLRTYGASFTTNVGEVNVFGEYTWTANAPVISANNRQLTLNGADAVPQFNAPVRVPVNQVNLGILHVLGSNFLSDQVNVIAETGIIQYQGIDNRDVKYDNHGWGVAMRMEHFYFSVLPGIDISIPLSVQVGLDGTVRESNIIEDAKTVGIGVNMVYLGNFSTGIQYATYFGADDENWVNDRDNVSLTVKYSM